MAISWIYCKKLGRLRPSFLHYKAPAFYTETVRRKKLAFFRHKLLKKAVDAKKMILVSGTTSLRWGNFFFPFLSSFFTSSPLVSRPAGSFFRFLLSYILLLFILKTGRKNGLWSEKNHKLTTRLTTNLGRLVST